MSTTATQTARTTFTRTQVGLMGNDSKFDGKDAIARVQGRDYSGTLVRRDSNGDLVLVLDIWETYFGATSIEVWSKSFNNLTPHVLESLTVKGWE